MKETLEKIDWKFLYNETIKILFDDEYIPYYSYWNPWIPFFYADLTVSKCSTIYDLEAVQCGKCTNCGPEDVFKWLNG